MGFSDPPDSLSPLITTPPSALFRISIIRCADAAIAAGDRGSAERAAAASALAAARAEMAGEIADARDRVAKAEAETEAIRQELVAAQAAAAAAAAAASDLAMRYGRSRSVAGVVKAVDALRCASAAGVWWRKKRAGTAAAG